MRDAFATELFKLAKSNRDVIFITADLGFGVFDKFAKAIEQVKEYCPASDEAKLPPKIVKDSVSKQINPTPNP